MLVPSSFQPLVNENSVNMGVTVMGGVVNQFAQALVMMSHCKFLGSAHYTIAKDTEDKLLSTVIFSNWSGISTGLNKSVKYYSFFYASTPISEWIGVIFQYIATQSVSSNSPQITFTVRDLSGTIISKPVLFEYPDHLQMSLDGLLDRPYVGTTGATFYDPPVGTSGTDQPRPLYIPSGSRGDMVIIEVKVEDCDIVQLDLFDLYQPEVTP